MIGVKPLSPHIVGLKGLDGVPKFSNRIKKNTYVGALVFIL